MFFNNNPLLEPTFINQLLHRTQSEPIIRSFNLQLNRSWPSNKCTSRLLCVFTFSESLQPTQVKVVVTQASAHISAEAIELKKLVFSCWRGNRGCSYRDGFLSLVSIIHSPNYYNDFSFWTSSLCTIQSTVTVKIRRLKHY
jgi:hypothetical protein